MKTKSSPIIDVPMYQGSNYNQYKACCCSFLGALSFGYVIGYTSPAIPQMELRNVLTEAESSWFGSVITVGAIVGCSIAGFTTDKFGRKASIMISTVPFFLGWLLISSTQTVLLLYTGRFLTGIGSGLVVVSCPLYVAEVSTKDQRGLLGSCIQLSITLGILLVYILGLYLNWNTLAFVAIVIPVINLAFTMLVPETPRYCLMKGGKIHAIKALSLLRGPHADVQSECESLIDHQNTDVQVSWLEFQQPELFRPLKIVCIMMLLQQFCGINVVMFYTVSIFKSAGLNDNSDKATVVIGIVQCIFTLISVYLVDRMGRRILLIIASLGLFFSCMAISLYYYFHILYGSVALVALIFYIIFFSLGLGPIPMLIMSELLPVHASARGASVASNVAWVSAFVVTKGFMAFQQVWGPEGAFMVFAICCLLGARYVYISVPETKGKSLEEIQTFFMTKTMPI